MDKGRWVGVRRWDTEEEVDEERHGDRDKDRV